MNQQVLFEAPKKISRDEMNLAEFPLAILSTRGSSTLKTLEFTDTIRGRNGDLVQRSWVITGADKFGLPTSSDEEVLLGLLKLTVESEFRAQKIYFSRYELLKALRWSTEGRNYSRIQKALDRLSGVRIKATNAFYDNATKSHSTVNFGLIDAYEINDGRENKGDGVVTPSFFIWSEVLFKSFKAGFIKKLDLDFYLDLKSAVSKRVYRFLDKHFWYKSKVKINLFTLAHEKVGISRNYKFASSLRQQLDPALDELKDAGFLDGYEYEGKGSGTEVVIYAAATKPRVLESGKPEVLKSTLSEPQAKVSKMLIERGLKEHQVLRLIANSSEIVLDRIAEIVRYYDKLLQSQSHLVSKSPVGFLYRAVENPEGFTLPSDLDRSRREERQTTLPFKSPALKENASLEAQYLVARKEELRRIQSAVEDGIMRSIEEEVRLKLMKLKRSISEDKFEQAVLHGVEERLLALYAFPEFSEWLLSRERKVA